MTDSVRHGGPSGPPWSVDLLADLHAGVLDEGLSSELWPRVNADPEARAVIEALDVVKVELGQLGNAPAAPMPAHFAAQLDAALEAEIFRSAPRQAAESAAAPVVNLADARRRRNRMMAWGTGVLTAAAAAAAITVAVLPGSNETPGSAVAGDKPPLAVEGDNLSAAIGGVEKQFDYGPLKDQAGVDACVKANGLDPAKAQTVGVRQVTLDGKRGVFVLLTSGQSGQFRLLVVGPDCGPGNPAKLANTLFPPR